MPHRHSWNGSWAWPGNADSGEIEALRAQATEHEAKLDFLKSQIDALTTLVTDLQSQVKALKDREPAAGAPERAPPRLPSPAASRPPTPRQCAHKGLGNTAPGSDDYQALQGHDIDCAYAYTSHLDATLFSEKGRATWKRMYTLLAETRKDFKISACLTKANRGFHIICLACGQGCKGRYGAHDDEAVHDEARQALSKFLLNEPTNDNGEV